MDGQVRPREKQFFIRIIFVDITGDHIEKIRITVRDVSALKKVKIIIVDHIMANPNH